jgi:PAS domain S-box-containing protein
MLGIRTDITERKQAEEAIRESEQLFSTIFYKSPVAISITSREDGKIVEANETFLHDLEFTRDDVIGKPIMELGIFYDPTYREKLIEELFKTGAVSGLECPFKTKSGKILFGIVSMSSILYKGKPHQLTSVINITDRKQAEIKIRDSERLLNESQRVSKIGSYTFDILSGYWEGSAYLNDMFGVDRSKPHSVEEWLGVIHPADREMMNNYFANEIIGKRQRFDKKYRIINQIDQQETWVHGYGELEFDQSGNPIKMIGTIQDITDWEKATNELIVAKEKAEQSDRLKSSFLANMSHEIRTPLNSIMGFASLLPEEESKEVMDQYANIIVQNSEQLVRLIDGIVLYSKLQTGLFSVNSSCFEISKLVEDIKQSFNLPMCQQEVALKCACEQCKTAEIYSDYDKLRQIITNLITNSFEYSHKGEITLGCIPQENSCEFYVKDTGIGIPDKDIPYIFDRFYRGSNIDPSRMSGTGLGLCIVKELVELLGGTIWVESNSDESFGEKGSCFYFSIPNKKQILK